MSTASVLELPYVSQKASERIELRVEPDLGQQIEEAAQSIGLNRTAYIRQATIEKMARDGRPYRPKKVKPKKDEE